MILIQQAYSTIQQKMPYNLASWQDCNIEDAYEPQRGHGWKKETYLERTKSIISAVCFIHEWSMWLFYDPAISHPE